MDDGDSAMSKYVEVEKDFEYLDHTADVQIHSWGESVERAFEQAVLGMFNYMTDVNGVLPKKFVEVTAEGSDIESLLFHLLDEFLFLSATDDFFMARQIEITEFDKENWRMKARGVGEDFDKERHGGKGTEVKAITYSAMKIIVEEKRIDVFVIIDI